MGFSKCVVDIALLDGCRIHLTNKHCEASCFIFVERMDLYLKEEIKFTKVFTPVEYHWDLTNEFIEKFLSYISQEESQPDPHKELIGKDQHDGEITTRKDKDSMLMVDSSSPDQMSIELVPHDEFEVDLGMDLIFKENYSIMDDFLEKVVNDNLSCLEVDNADLGMDFISKECDIRADLEVIENNNKKLTCLDKDVVLEDVFMTKDDMSCLVECTSTDLVEESVYERRECNIFLDKVVEDLSPVHNNDLDIETFDTNIEITQRCIQTCQKCFDECLDQVCANHERKLEVVKNNNENAYIHESDLLLQQSVCDMFQVEGVQGSEKCMQETKLEMEVLHQDQQHKIAKSSFDFTHSNELSREIS